VDVASLAVRLPRESQNRRLIDEPVGDRHGLRGRRQELSPRLEGEVRHHNRGPLAMPSADEAEHLVGVLAIEIRESRVVEEQQIGHGHAAERLPVGTVRARGVELFKHIGERAVVDRQPAAAGALDLLSYGNFTLGGGLAVMLVAPKLVE
jgi:hypothetical protein